MKSNDRKKTGIVDIQKKWTTMQVIVGEKNRKKAFKKILKMETDSVKQLKLNAFYDAASRWNKSIPTTTYSAFFPLLFKALGLEGKITKDEFINCKYSDFYNRLSHENRKKIAVLEAELEDSVSDLYEEKNRYGESIFIFSESFNPDLDISKAMVEKTIDQKYIYLNPYVKAEWKKLITQKNHNPYMLCKKSLDALLDTPAWKNYLQKTGKNLNRIVFLGAGGEEKETLIISEITAIKKSPFNILLIDASTSMLEFSCEFIKLHFRTSKPKPDYFIPIMPIRADFTKLHELSEFPMRNQHNCMNGSIYFLLGGAFGNNAEDRFLENIKPVMCQQDLLVINAEFFEKNEQEEYEQQSKEEYLKSEQMSFIMATLLPYLNILHRDKSIEEIEEMIEVVIIKNAAEPRLCPVPGSIAVARQLKIPLPNDNFQIINISMSKKYVREELMNFFDQHGFEYDQELSNQNQISIRLKHQKENEQAGNPKTAQDSTMSENMTALPGEIEKQPG